MSTFRSEEEEYDDLRECLARWPRHPGSEAYSIDCHARLASCLFDLLEGRQPQSGDIASHVAAVLRRQSLVSGSADMLIPASSFPWPDDACWARHGIEAEPNISTMWRLSAQAWRPDWLPGSNLTLPAAGLFDSDRHMRRQQHRVPADPSFAAALGPDFGDYVSPGQRQAVRTVLASRPGSTIIVSLPTGGGKTEVALVEALLAPSPSVTVVVVPTIALALDQERRLQGLLRRGGDGEAAAMRYGYLGDDHPQLRAEIRRRIRSGQQRVVFAPPESVVGSLASSLFDAASAGALRLLVIDEAHLIPEWGADFRPEFQVLAGLRAALLRTAINAGHSPFKTLLLSATLPQATLDVIERLFGSPGPLEMTLAVALRAEPSYWNARCRNEDERHDRFLDAVANLPRPAVIYVAKRADAERWRGVLTGAGYSAVRVFTSDSTGQQRREVLSGLRGPWGAENPRTDIVVATTAFGLGVDQPNIRVVIHLCVPESLDRFYQEVGRGGRDGHPSVSLVLWTDDDIPMARSLAVSRLITPELGLQRWDALVSAGRNLGDGRRQLKLDTRPGHLAFSSRANRLWNTRTLGLMAQAGLIALDAERPKREELPRKEELGPDRSDPDVASVVVRIRRGDASLKGTWETQVAPMRAQLLRANREGLSRMLQSLRPGRKVCEALQAAYTTTTPSGTGVIPILSCAGCPGCRPRVGTAGVPPEPPALRHPDAYTSPELDRLFAGANHLLVTTQELDWSLRENAEQLYLVVRACLRHGIEVVIADHGVLERLNLRNALNHTRRRVLFTQSEVGRLSLIPDLPMLFIAGGAQAGGLADVLMDTRPTARRIILTDSCRPDPVDPGRLIGDKYYPQYAVDTFLGLV